MAGSTEEGDLSSNGSSEEASWVSKLKEFNLRHGKDVESPVAEGGDSDEDRSLLKKYYVEFKGQATDKYSVIPKFYSKVCSVRACVCMCACACVCVHAYMCVRVRVLAQSCICIIMIGMCAHFLN